MGPDAPDPTPSVPLAMLASSWTLGPLHPRYSLSIRTDPSLCLQSLSCWSSRCQLLPPPQHQCTKLAYSLVCTLILFSVCCMPSKLMLLYSQGIHRTFQKCLQKEKGEASTNVHQLTPLTSAPVTPHPSPHPSPSCTVAQPPLGPVGPLQ